MPVIALIAMLFAAHGMAAEAPKDPKLAPEPTASGRPEPDRPQYDPAKPPAGMAIGVPPVIGNAEKEKAPREGR